MSNARVHFAIRNRQRTRRIDLPALRRLVRALLAGPLEAAQAQLCFHLVGAREITRLNESFLGHQGSTDVITFDHADLAESLPADLPPVGRGSRRAGRASGKTSPGSWPVTGAEGKRGFPLGRSFQGEIYISVDDAVGQARRFRTTWQAEVVRYVIHGLLHLAGHDDQRTPARRRMKLEEDRLLRWAARQFSIGRLAAARP